MIKNVIRRINDITLSDSSIREVAKGASTALIISIIGSLLGIAVSLIIARKYGAEGIGVYYLALSIIVITSTIGRVGLDNTVVRFVASYAAAGDWAAVKFVYAAALKIVSIASFIVSIALIMGTSFMSDHIFNKPTMKIPFLVAAIAVMPYSLSIVQAEALRGLKKILISQVIKTVLIAMGTLILIYPASLFLPYYGSVLSYTAAAISASIIAWFLWKKGYRDSAAGENKQKATEMKLASLLESSWPFYGVAISGLIIQQSVTVILGIWGAVEDVGIYSTANRVASLLLFPLFAMISILTPKYAALHHQGDMASMAHLARNSAKMLALIVAPVAGIVYLSAEWILAIFGEEFISGAAILRILLAGVLVNVVTGSVAELLMMTGHGKITSHINITGALTIIVLSIVLIPIYGGRGAAIAMSAGYIIINVLMVVMVRRFLGFWPVGLRGT